MPSIMAAASPPRMHHWYRFQRARCAGEHGAFTVGGAALHYVKPGCAAIGESLEFHKMPNLKVIQDVETRWWSTHACSERLLYLRAAIGRHEASTANSPNTYATRILSDKRWTVSEYIVPLLEPSMLVQRAHEAEKYVIISLVVSNIQALRLGLRDEMNELQAELPAGTPTCKAEARAIVLCPRSFR